MIWFIALNFILSYSEDIKLFKCILHIMFNFTSLHYHWSLAGKWILWVSDRRPDPAFTWTWFTCHALKPWFFIGNPGCSIGACIYDRLAAYRPMQFCLPVCFCWQITCWELQVSTRTAAASLRTLRTASRSIIFRYCFCWRRGSHTSSAYSDLSMSYHSKTCLEYRSWLRIWL